MNNNSHNSLTSYYFGNALKQIRDNHDLWAIKDITRSSDIHFSQELNLIVKELKKRECKTIEELTVKYILLSFAYSLSRKTKKHINKAFKKVDETLAKIKFPHLYIYLKYTIIHHKRILIVTHFGDEGNSPDRKNVYKILNYRRNIDKINISDYKTTYSLIHKINHYDQVFFIGHASELKVKNQKQLLQPTDFQCIENFRTNVIGFLNCNDRFLESDIMTNRFDVIFHDDQSVTDYLEFFLSKYLYEYAKSKSLFHSLDNGKLAMWLKQNGTFPSLINVRINKEDYFKLGF